MDLMILKLYPVSIHDILDLVTLIKKAANYYEKFRILMKQKMFKFPKQLKRL